MASSSCTSCGLRSQHCQCRREASTAANGAAFKLTRTSFCVIYLVTTTTLVLLFTCLLLLSPNSESDVTRTADWNVSFVDKNPGNGCTAYSLHTIKSRLFRGEDKLISESITPDYFGLLVTGKIDEPLSYSVFKTVATQEGMIWDLRVKVVFSVKINDDRFEPNCGFLIVNCGDIPVNFTADAAGTMKGSLVGYMRPCEYLSGKTIRTYPFRVSLRSCICNLFLRVTG